MQPTTPAQDRSQGTIRGYPTRFLRADVIAGLSVAVMGAPQAMAYAMIAKLPPVYGLYTAVVTALVAALLGSSSHLMTGPTNGLCIVMSGVLIEYADLDERLEVAFLLTFLAGTFQLAFGLLRLGGIVRYVANSVVIGFTAGAGILIALKQVKNMLGVEFPADLKVTNSFEVALQTAKRFGETNWFALAIGVVAAVLMVLAPKWHRRLPGALVAVVVGGVLCYLLGWQQQVQLVKDMGAGGISGSLDIFHLPKLVVHPDWDLTGGVLSVALAMAVLGLIEATSISREIARSSEQRLDFNREFVGQGASKVVGAFFSCFASSGSFTRTALNYKSGGRTRMAAIFCALWTALILVGLGPVANYIPTPALAGLLIVTAYSMVDKQRIRLSWRSGPNSRLVLLGTVGATLVLPLQYAIFVGIFLSLFVILRTTGKTNLTQLVPRDDGGFDEVPFNRAPVDPVVIVNMDGDIYFAAAEDLDSELLKCLTPKTRVVVLRMKRLRAVGSTAMAMLTQFSNLLRRRNVHLVVSGIEKDLEDVLTDTGVRAKIGEPNIFFADIKMFQSTELALARARSIAGIEKAEVIEGDGRLRARDLMSAKCIRFGHKHQLREAVWLLSELHKHTKSLSYQPLFLQDPEGRLFGELSPWRVLDWLLGGTEGCDAELDDERIAALLRRDFTRPIRLIARTEVAWVPEDASLVEVLRTAAGSEQQVLPVCNRDRRVKGLVRSEDLLQGLEQLLRRDAAARAAAEAAAAEAAAEPEPAAGADTAADGTAVVAAAAEVDDKEAAAATRETVQREAGDG